MTRIIKFNKRINTGGIRAANTAGYASEPRSKRASYAQLRSQKSSLKIRKLIG